MSHQCPNEAWRSLIVEIPYPLQVVKDDLSPRWRPITIKLEKLCAGDLTKEIQVHILILLLKPNGMYVMMRMTTR